MVEKKDKFMTIHSVVEILEDIKTWPKMIDIIFIARSKTLQQRNFKIMSLKFHLDALTFIMFILP